MQKVYTRQRKQHQTDRITDSANTYLKSEFTYSRRFKVESSNSPTALVILGVHQWTVQLSEGKCTCRAFQDRKIPCRHAIAVCREHNLEPEDYVSDFYKMEAYRSTYMMSMPPIRVEGLEESDFCLAPRFIKPKGRPKKKRIRKGVSNADKKVRRCTYCGSSKHNSKTCDRASDEDVDSAGSADDSDTSWQGIEEEWEGFEDDEWEGFEDIEPARGSGNRSQSGTAEDKVRTALQKKGHYSPYIQELLAQSRAEYERKRQEEEDALLYSPQHSPTLSISDASDDSASEAEANWAIAEDPEEAQCRWYMSEDSGPAGRAHWATVLHQHLAYKASNPTEVARAIKRRKEFLADKNRHRLTAEQLKVIFPPRPPSGPDPAAMFRERLRRGRCTQVPRRTVEEGGEEAVEQQEGEGTGVVGEEEVGEELQEVEEGSEQARTQASVVEEPLASTRPRRKAAVAAEAAWASLKPSGKRPRAVSAVGSVESSIKSKRRKELSDGR